MLRAIASTAAGVALFSAAALAQANIPSKYSGRFPSDGVRTNIAGTYSGKRLSLRFTRAAGQRASRRATGKTSPGQRWICPLGGLFAP